MQFCENKRSGRRLNPKPIWDFSFCSACVLELAAAGQCCEETGGPLREFGQREAPWPVVLTEEGVGGGGGGIVEAQTGNRKLHPFPGAQRSRLSSASPSARPPAAARPPRGRGCSSCSAPGREAHWGNGLRGSVGAEQATDRRIGSSENAL